MPPPRKWMMPVALSIVILSAFGCTKKMDDASRSILGDAECSWLDRRHHLKLAMNPNERFNQLLPIASTAKKDHETQSPRKVSKTQGQRSCMAFQACVGRKAKTPRHLAMLSMLCVSCAPKVENLHQSTSLGNSKDSLQWRKANQNPRLSAMLSSLSAFGTQSHMNAH